MGTILLIGSHAAYQTWQHALDVDELYLIDETNYRDDAPIDVIVSTPEAIPLLQETCRKHPNAQVLLLVSTLSDDVLQRMRVVNADDYLLAYASPFVVQHRLQQSLKLHEAQQRERKIRELKERNSHLDAFVGVVAHDLQNPVATVIGYASTLRTYYDRMPTEDVWECIDNVTECAHQMSDTIEAMLTLARIDNSQQIELRPVDLCDVLEQVIIRLGIRIRETRARIDLPRDCPQVMGHQKWLVEILANYVSNAIKYGGDPPRVRLGAEMQPDGFVRVWVQDNGAGISPKDQARVFNPFERLDKSQNGSGLGLTIVQRMVEHMGGSVGVHSSPQGSIFDFTLPATSHGRHTTTFSA